MDNNSKRAKANRQERALTRLENELLKEDKMSNNSIGNIKRINNEINILKQKLNK